MEWKKLVNGPSHKYRGSLMVVAIATLGILTFLYLSLAENYQLTVFTANRHSEYYKMAIMKELFLAEYLAIPKAQRPVSGTYYYSTGSVTFTQKETVLSLVSKTKKNQQTYQEKLLITEETNDSKQGESSDERDFVSNEGVQIYNQNSTDELRIESIGEIE